MTQGRNQIFKSVNIRLDSQHPERFAHFHPTRKSCQAMNSVLHGIPSPAGMIVAAYGSGKSLAAGTALMAVENSPDQRPYLVDIADSLKRIDPELSKSIHQRVRSQKNGLVIALEGHHADLQAELCAQAKEQLPRFRANKPDLNEALSEISKKASEFGYERIAIVWDEFGRCLEELAASGQATSLSPVQQLAEWASRQKQPKATVTLLLHQNFSNYAGSLSQASLSSWRKIEGRFNSIRFIEDSCEIFELVASVIKDRRPDKVPPPLARFKKLAKAASDLGMFAAFENIDRLAHTLRDAHPLHPAALYALPRLASRLAQNERTIFTFIEDADLSQVHSLESLYRYFASAMEVDAGLGGTYKRWLETESALTKTLSQLEREIIAAAALLSLGGAGERAKVSKKTLLFSVSKVEEERADAVSRAVKELLDRSLLLHRVRNDDISVWHGTDIDLRSYLQEQKARLDADFDPITALEKEFQAPYWYPIKHNIENCIRRYYQGQFVAGDDLLRQGQSHPALCLLPGEDGRIIYCLPSSPDEARLLVKFACKTLWQDPGLVITIPGKVVPFTDVLIEITALRSLLTDPELLGRDPFVQPELMHMLDAAQESLWRMMTHVVSPASAGLEWYSCGKPFNVHNGAELRTKLSELASERFPMTPVIRNEMIVRHNPSRTMVNARKKLVLGVLERTGSPTLGFNPDATTPDVAMYRTLLRNTRLHIDAPRAQCWASTSEMENAALKAVWSELKKFFETPLGAKSPTVLVQTLTSPPYGIRRGVLPVLVASGLQAFGRALAIRRKGEYLPDILASEIEEICNSPELYSVEVLETEPRLLSYFGDLVELFSGSRPNPDTDRVRAFYDALADWKKHLPAPALTAKQVSKQASSFQRLLRATDDPVVLALGEFPKIARQKRPNVKTIQVISKLRVEIEGIIDRYTALAIDSIRSSLTVTDVSQANVLSCVVEWAECCAGANDVSALDPAGRSLLSRAREAASGRYTEASFARALSALLIGKGIDGWDDVIAKAFRTRLREAAAQVEQAAIDCANSASPVAFLLRRRIEELFHKLSEIQDSEDVTGLLSDLGRRLDPEKQAARKVGRMAKGSRSCQVFKKL